jgi:aerobic-type carbon monoxide dehydrogenase small subunit (CoxS/CutS family)
MKIGLDVNGSHIEFDAEPGDTLLETLRANGYTSVKNGCAHGDCGTCAVLLDGRAVASCLLFAAQAQGRDVTTVEGLAGAGEAHHPLQQTLLDAGGVQCGFCIPGIIVTAADLLAINPRPTRSQIARYLVGNLCRCTGYVKQIEAVEMAAAILDEGAVDD